MRKVLLSVVASCALIAFVPATALAKRHNHRSHGHHARVHHKKFGTDPSSTPSSPSSGQTAGTVQSFTGGVLTILLSDGKTTVSGQVTADTEIVCQSPQSSGMSPGEGGGNGGGDDHGDQNQSGNQGQGNNGHDDNDDQSDQGDRGDEGANQSCDSSALTTGAVVQEAELNISGSGAVWRKVELVSSSSSTTSTSSTSGGDE